MSETWNPAPYQLKAVQWLLERSAAALFLDPGLRKTSCTYAALKVLKNEGLLDGAVIVAPLRPAQMVWPAEQKKWTEFGDLDVVLLHGPRKDKLVAEKHDVYVVNYEGLAWLTGKKHLRALLKNKWVDTLVFDELSKMKHTRTARFKTIAPWLPKFRRRWGLTGSPAANGLMNLFGEVQALDLGAAFGPYITYFRARYFLPVGDYDWRIQPGAEQLIYDRIKPLALRMDASDYLQLPKLLPPTVIKYDLPSAARKMYDELEEELVTLLMSGERLTAPTASVVRGKLRQIAGGAVLRNEYDPITGIKLRTKGDEWVLVHDEKLDALEALVDELEGTQLLVGYEYIHDLERLLKRFGKDTPYIGGGVSLKKALEIEAAWNAGEIPLLFGQPQSVGHGLNFQGSHAHHVAWFTLTDDYELYDQFIKRLLRSGNKASRLFVYHFIARNTTEEAVAANLRRKAKGQQGLFDAINEYLVGKYKSLAGLKNSLPKRKQTG